MGKIAFVIDSTVYLPEKVIKDNNVKVVSLNVIDGETTHKELEIDNDFVYKRQAEKAGLTTSQPSPQEFLDVYQACIDEGAEEILVMTISKGISGTYQSAVLAKSMLDDKVSVYIFDTNTAAYGVELHALDVIDMIKAGKTSKKIIERVNKNLEHSELYFTVENLYSLQQGGRLSKVQAMLGTVLRVKPIIKMTDGKLKLCHKERTFKKLYVYIMDQIKNDPNREGKTLNVRLIEINSEENMDELVSLVKAEFKKPNITTTSYIGPVFSIHIGNKGFGLAWYYA